MSMKERLDKVEKNIAEAAHKTSRDLKDITLIGVTKTHSIESMQELVDLGVTDIGENKAQEVRDKYDLLQRDVRWHFIGHLQRNKVKYLIDTVYMIHSVESESLAKEISKRALKAKTVMPILLEVNVSGEESKFGLSAENVESFINKIQPLKGIEIQGLMTMAPHADNVEKTRPVFKELKQLFDQLNDKGYNLTHLSMGMSNDYMVAIEEGATMVRVGTAIMGGRDYSK